jgi:hypothetical protein
VVITKSLRSDYKSRLIPDCNNIPRRIYAHFLPAGLTTLTIIRRVVATRHTLLPVISLPPLASHPDIHPHNSQHASLHPRSLLAEVGW